MPRLPRAADRATAESLARRLRCRPPRLGPVRLVAVDGPSGAGKSTFARVLLSALVSAGTDAALLGTDDFATWQEPVRWWPRLREGVLEPLRLGRPGRYRRTEWPGGVPVPGASLDVPVPELLLLEGVSAGRRSVARHLSGLVWMEPPSAAVRLERAVLRDGESSRRELLRWQLFEGTWFRSDRTRRRADFVLRT
ncbi:uridine kinase family protein [Actinopolyspora erythraea]|uniref:uridine kinase family protein n=1 Tax=Actinopolyspora erythraea TaxID=414996 RepID=UPI001CB77631|nr:hypothetical protein [Actinopolyspora erythraea]